MAENHPTGILTFLFTDLEGSTQLWEKHPQTMPAAMAQHDALLQEMVAAHNGLVVKTTGDGLHAVFESAADCTQAALAAQTALHTADWPEATGPLRVRMGLHTGEGQYRDGDYYGTALNRAARLMSIGHGGQVLLSGITARLVREKLPPESTLLDLGEHHLRDLSHPEHVSQLCHPDLPNEFPPLKSLATFRHNLPLQLNTFIGREHELDEIHRLLHKGRLVTLLGPGGTGKTRLMLQAAADLLDHYPNGVWLVELAPLAEANLLVERVAKPLNIQENPNRPILDTLLSTLRQKNLLLLLDNVEHLVAESAVLAEQMLSHCPQLSILVTGRESLFIAGETTYQVPSLGLPTENSTNHDEVLASEAVQLFIERAQAARPDFQLTPGNAPAIVEIVQRLDGIPLALELAAARLRMMSVEQIASRLNDRFRLLTGGRRTALPRQQTLQALIDWSWNLLTDSERCLLRRLSVFAGGWTLEAAEAVADLDGTGLPPDNLYVFDGLDQLVSKSLVIADHQPGHETRYRMLESIHQYAQDRLLEAEEALEMRNRHAEYYVTLMETADPHFRGPDMMVWIDRLAPEIENLKAVQNWTLEGAFELAVRLGQISYFPWRYFWTPAETQSWLEQVIHKLRAIPPETFTGGMQGYESALGRILIRLGVVFFGKGENTASKEVLTEGVELVNRAGDTRATAFGLLLKATAEFSLGNFPGMKPLIEQAMALARQNDYQYELAGVLGARAGLAILEKDWDQGQAYWDESTAIQEQIGNPSLKAQQAQFHAGMARLQGDFKLAQEWYTRGAELYLEIKDQVIYHSCLSGVAHCLRWMGKQDEAGDIYRKTILHYQEQGHLPAVAHQLECFADIAVHSGKAARAARLLGAAQKLRRITNEPIHIPSEKADYEKTMAALEAVLDPDTLQTALAEGKQMDVDVVVAYARSSEQDTLSNGG